MFRAIAEHPNFPVFDFVTFFFLQDLGCGWGSLSLYICEKYPKCKVTCVSNSNTQRQLIQERARTRGFAGRLECITADANVFTTANRYDRIFSIEMFEVCFARISFLIHCSLLFDI